MDLRPATSLNLKVGDRLNVPVIDRNGLILLQRGKVIESASVLERINERGFYLREVLTTPIVESPVVEDALSSSITPQHRLSLLTQRVGRILSMIREAPGPAVQGDIVTLLGWINELFHRDADQFIGVQQLLVSDHSLLERALHLAVVTKLICVADQVPVEHHLPLMGAALTLDVGAMEFHDCLAQQSGPLSAEQQALVASHTMAGVELLKACEITDPLWLDAVASHHERLDGSGYPRRLRGAEVPQGARIVALADVFTAMQRPRGDRPAFLPADALKDMFARQADKLDGRLIQMLIRQLGMYPPGSVVRLANSEIAVCTRRTADARRPMMRAVIAPDGSTYAVPKRRDPTVSQERIAEVIPPNKVRPLRTLIAGLWQRDADTAE